MTLTHPTAPQRTPLGLGLSLALAGALLLGGCATAVKNPPVWPPPPDEGRIRFIRSIQKEGDVETGTLRKIWRFLVPASNATVIRQPIGIAISPDDKRLYVANGIRGNVVRVDLETGEFELVAYAQERQADRPMSVALDAEENLYVANDTSNTVMVFSRKGRFLREFGKDKLVEPKALAIDRKGQILYVLNGMSRKSQSHRIDVYSLKGEHVRTIGKRGAGPGEFNYPSAIAVAPDGRIFVADMLNFRVQILDGEGNPQGSFGQIGSGQPGTFDKAKGIALDTFGNIYVSDGQQAFVQLFNSQFRSLMGFGGRAALPGYLWVPGAIAIDSRNHIYVGDSATGKVNEYELFGTTPEDSFKAPPEPTAPTAPTAPTGPPAAAPR